MVVFLVFFSICTNINAGISTEARIGNRFFDSLEEAIEFASSTDTISLTTNISLKETIEIHKTVNINLNGFDIKAPQKVFLIQGGSLNLSGKGKIIETNPYYGAITLIGSDDPSKKDFSTVSVGKDITLQGWAGIFINHNNKTGYGILVNMNGTINAVNDINGDEGIGIYVNGNIQNENNSPIINLSDTAKITSTGNGIYAAGYATYNINGAYISGVEAALGIKSGIFNILDGTIIGIGEDKTPTTGNNNGINASGSAIQIESNPGYAGNIELNIKKGNIKSKHSNVIYEYTVNTSDTNVKDININGGTYISEDNKPVFLLSDKFKQRHKNFISAGTFSSDPSAYLKSGYTVTKNDKSLYEVITSTISVFGIKNQNKNFSFFSLIPLIALIIIIYIYREKIIKLFKRKF